MKNFTLLLIFCLISFATMFGQAATVRVQDGSGTAIMDAAVILNATTVLTDVNGNAIFPGLADGNYPYSVTADCYEDFSGALDVAGADVAVTAALSLSTTNDLFINLVPPGGIGFPPAGVTVRVFNDDLSYDETVVTGGFTQLTAVPYGTYNYTLSQDCKVTVNGTTTVECTPGDIDALVAEFGINQTTNDLFINLVPPGGIGFPPAGVTVRVFNDDLSYDETVVTGGFTQLTAVPYGTYNYTLSQDCKVTVNGTTTVECTPGDIDALVAEFGINQTTNDLFINLVPPGGIGFPPTGVTVRVFNDDLSYDETVVTGGFTQLNDVPYGTYNYTLSQDCKVTVNGTTTVECTPGDIDALVAEFGINQTTNDLFINLVPPGGIGFPPTGVTVRVFNDDFTYDETVVTGGFTQLNDVPYGTYNYTLSQDCKVTVNGTTTVECTPGDIDALVAEFGVNQTTNDLFINLVPPGGIGFPPTGVTVRVFNDDFTYDETVVTGGFTQLNDVPYGTYNYTLSQDCKVTVNGTTTVECTPGDIDALVAEFGINQTTNNVFFFVGNLLQQPDVTITVTNTTTFEQTSITGQNVLGDYILENLPYGDYNYTVSKECFISQTGQVTVNCQPNDGEGNQLGNVVALGDLVPNTTNNIFFFIGNLFQEPDVTITLTNTTTFEQTSITGQNFLGDYVLENLPYGDYNYTVSKECFVSQTGQVTVDCQPNDGEGNQLGNVVALGDLVPNTTNNVFFFVGNLFQEPDVTITLTNTATSEQTSITGQNFLGDYILENLPYGDYDYTVSKECFVSQTGQVTVNCQPNDGEGNQLGNVVALGDLVPNVLDNSVTQVDATLTANATGVSYQWILCDGTEIDGETNASFTPTATGEYAVVVTDDNCSLSSTSECFSVMIVGVTSLSTDNLSFYPNPVQDELRINFEENVNNVKVRIFNINGQLLINQEFPQAEMIKLDMSKLLSGTYILDLTVDGESLKTPIVKM